MKKFNPTKAQRELMASEQAMRDKWASVPKFGRTWVRPKAKAEPVFVLSTPPGRESPRLPSRVTPGGSTTKPNLPNVYTGDKMLGIGTLHKSNAVPVFSTEEAGEMARMRRG